MARLCSQCKYYTNGDETTCPKCNIPMQFTLLPPPGANAAPLVIDRNSIPHRVRARDMAPSPSWSVWDLFRSYRASRALIATPLAIIMIICGAFFGWGKDDVYARFDRIQVGMTEKQVRDILQPPRRGKYSTPEWYKRPIVDNDGYDEVDITENGLTLHLEFMDGRLTFKSVESVETAGR